MKALVTKTRASKDISDVMKNMGNFQGKFNLDKSGFNPEMPGHKTEHQMVLRRNPGLLKRMEQV